MRTVLVKLPVPTANALSAHLVDPDVPLDHDHRNIIVGALKDWRSALKAEPTEETT